MTTSEPSGTAPSRVDGPVMVQTVTGPVRADELGVTLTHEHLFGDLSDAFHLPSDPHLLEIVDAPVTPWIAAALREDPYGNRDNIRIDAEMIAEVAEEVAAFRAVGGRTVVDSSTGPERHPTDLRELARRTGLQVVMAGGWCLSHGDERQFTDDDVAAMTSELVGEIREGVLLPDGTRVRVGSIGEIGVGLDFTPAERATLVAACLAQVRTGLPLFVHLPGWQRRGHEVLDVVAEHGVDPGAVVLCHMDPSGRDTGYQREIADRGVWLGFDMVAMALNYPGEGESPSVADTTAAVAGLVEDGYAGQLLLSHDVGLKVQWARNGGTGLTYVPTAFVARLVAAGVDEQLARGLLTENPAALFTAAWTGTPQARLEDRPG